jgi:hypothetical protein
MRDEIRYPNKVVWVVVGLIALFCAWLMLLVPSGRKEPTPPYDLRLFLVHPPQSVSINETLEAIKKDPTNREALLQAQHYYAYHGEWEKVIEMGKRIVSITFSHSP